MEPSGNGASTVAKLSDELLDVFFAQFPLTATVMGIRERDDELTEYSTQREAVVRAQVADIAARVDALDPAGLSATDRVTQAVVLQQTAMWTDILDARMVEYTLTDLFVAPVADLLFMIPMVTIGDQAQADAYLARLALVPRLVTTVADRNRAGVAAGLLPVRSLVTLAIGQLDRYLAERADDPFARPAPPADGTVDTAKFEAERDRLIDEVIRPALARYREVLASEIEPHGRPDDRAGLRWLPGGDGIYASLIRIHTTTERSAEDLHRTGLEIIDRLAEEYRAVGARVFGTDDVTEIFRRMRTDPALRWTSGEEVLEAARAAIARAEAAAPRWFGRLPAQHCEVQAVPANEAPGAPGAYYMPPALDGSRPGIYFANTYRAEERDRHGAQAVAFHEAVPGHHLQGSLALELTDLPMLRRLAPVTAYLEGWALYAERLADEMGLYSDDVARLGMLGEDSMRAARLVVDTGLHAKGWSRQQAVDYMVANTAMPQVEIESETDRYIADPGQALAYMVGRLEIQRIRADAERVLGERFDIRAFHDTVLCNGPLPLGVLETVVRDWTREMPGR
jgi:uncharacterized protein (DUF885 family)